MFEVLHPVTNKPVPMPPNGWRYSRDSMSEKIKQNRIVFGKDESATISSKTYLNEVEQQAIRPAFFQVRANASDALTKLLGVAAFDYPKDVGVLAKWIDALTGSDRESLILDFFAGSGSTAHAVMNLNAADEGNRRFILVQLDEELAESAPARKHGYVTLSDVARERLRRAGAQIAHEAGLMASNLDVGFRSLHVATTNMVDTLTSAEDLAQIALSDAVNSVKPGRTDEDLLFQVLLDWGLDLGESIEAEEIGGARVFSVAGDALIACFSPEVADAVVRSIATRHPLRAVFLDAGFATDAARINAEQIFREVSPETEVRAI